MVRKAPATSKTKGSQKNETYMPGITESADFIQSAGDPAGPALDRAVSEAASSTPASSTPAREVMDMPIGGLNSEIAAPVNSK